MLNWVTSIALCHRVAALMAAPRWPRPPWSVNTVKEVTEHVNTGAETQV